MTIYKKKTSSKKRVNYRQIYEKFHGKIPKESNGRTYEIHHIDGNHENNDPSNLKAVTIQEHYDIHYAQDDFAACMTMSKRMNLSPTEKSNIAKLNAQQQLESGIFNMMTRPDGTSFSADRVKNGVHHWSGKSHFNYDHEVYKFMNRSTTEIVMMTQCEFYKKFNFSPSKVWELVNQKRKSHKDWIIV